MLVPQNIVMDLNDVMKRSLITMHKSKTINFDFPT